MKTAVGRPQKLTDTAPIFVNSASVRAKLQAGSDRRAIVNKIIDAGGSITLGELNGQFGFDVRAVVRTLIRDGWLAVN